MKVALYARVSTERQAERGTIGSQLQVLRERVTADGDELVSEYVDDGHSGARLDRPGLDALRDAAEGGLFEAVWCLSPDRLARAYAYQVLVLDELARFGVTVLFTDSAGTVSSADQRLGQAVLMRRCRVRLPAPRSSFAGFRFPPEVIMVAVRWYLRYGLSYRDVGELLAERGIEVDHVSIFRWV